MKEPILFLPLDAQLEGLEKGPAGFRPPPQAKRAPSMAKPPSAKMSPPSSGGGMKVPKGNQPKPMNAGAAPKSPGASAGGGGGGKKYDYIESDTPPPGNEGRTAGGYWKVPKGMGSSKTAMNPAEPDLQQKEKQEATVDPLKMQPHDQKVHDALAANGKQAAPHPQDVPRDPKQPVDIYSTDKDHFKDADAGVHDALAEKFRQDGDHKMAYFHENLSKEKNKITDEANSAWEQEMAGVDTGDNDPFSAVTGDGDLKVEEGSWDPASVKNDSDDPADVPVSALDQNQQKPKDPATADVSSLDSEDVDLSGIEDEDVDLSGIEDEDVDLSELEAKPNDPANAPVEQLDEEVAAKQAGKDLEDHKAAGARTEKEISDKHSAKEKELTASHKERENALKEGHAKTAKELAEKHSTAEKDLKAKHAAKEKSTAEKHATKRAEMQAKHDAKHKELTDSHRAAEDGHAKAKKKLASAKASGNEERAKEATREIEQHKKTMTVAKRKLADHKAAHKAKLDAHKESSAQELSALKQKHANELSSHKEKTKSALEDHKQNSAKELETHKQTTAKELDDHRSAAAKELDSHKEAHGAKTKELSEKHAQSKEVAKQATAKKKAEAQQQKKAEAQKQKEAQKQQAEAAANERRPPQNDQEKLKVSAHKDKARKLQQNIKTHLDNPDLDSQTKEKLQQAHDMLEEHANSEHVPTPEMEGQLKEAEKAAGEHGKKPSESADPNEQKEKTPKDKTHGGSRWSSIVGAYDQGSAYGNAAGAASAKDTGAMGAATLQYGVSGTVSGGLHLLSQVKHMPGESEKATQAVANKRHEPTDHSGAATSDRAGSADETATVSAKKSIRLYVRL